MHKKQPFWFWVSLILLSIFVLGCGNKKDTTEPPSPLVEFDAEAQFEELWSISTGKGAGRFQLMLSPFLSGNTLYVADHKGRLLAVNKDTGKILWDVKTELAISAGVGGGEGLLFVGTREGELAAYWQKDGALAWKVEASSEVLAVPTADLGVVVIRTVDGNLQAFSVTDGATIWSHKNSVPRLSLRGTSKPVIFAGGVLSGTDNGRLSALAVNDGRLLWETPVAVPTGRSELSRLVDIDAPVIADKGIIYASAFQGRAVAISIEGGQVLWARDKSIYLQMSLDAGKLYAADQNSHVWAFDRRVGSTVWTQDKLHARPLSGTASVGQYIIVGDFKGYLHAMHKSDGRFVARMCLGKKGIQVSPIVDEDVMYVLSREGKLAALRIQKKS